MNEFELISHFFNAQRIQRDDVILRIGDDSAIVAVPPDQQLAITTDTLIAGTHFPLQTAPYDIGYKALAVNLSDLAAMGATPAWITLALTLPEAELSWLTEFCRGFFTLATQYNVQLIGGDLTCGPLSITIQAQGLVPKNQAITRHTAKPDDLIYVTHTLGDAGLALLSLNKTLSIDSIHQEKILTQLNRPEPRVLIGEKLRGIATAAIDISDGLAADLNHILKQSHVGACINVEKIPLSQSMRDSVSLEQGIAFALSAGDDYELCFTVPPEKQHLIKTEWICTCIGVIKKQPDLEFTWNNGKKYYLSNQGYQHF